MVGLEEDDIRALEAKVSGNVVFASSSALGVSFGVIWDARGAAANGFGEEFEVENGLNGAFPAGADENGFTGVAPGDLTPNNDSPMRLCGFGSSCLGAGFAAGWVFGLLAPFAILTPLIPRMLPSFLRHVFLRQVKIYSRLSWPGNWLGRSPFNSSINVSKSLQTLHFASAPDGAVFSSSHV